jgi:hypothetical protein
MFNSATLSASVRVTVMMNAALTNNNVIILALPCMEPPLNRQMRKKFDKNVLRVTVGKMDRSDNYEFLFIGHIGVHLLIAYASLPFQLILFDVL